MKKSNKYASLLASACFAAGVAVAGVSTRAVALELGPAVCGDLHNAYGPLDFRTSERESVARVVNTHFTEEVEALRSGHAGYLGGDLDYTLRALPNYPRALMAVARYATKVKSDRPPNMHWPAECYFERGVRFRPDDPMPHLIWAIFLRDRKRMAEAKSQVEQAEALRGEPTNFDLDYNIGLLYFELGSFDKSLVAATRAYALGAPLPALRNKLKSAGKWQEPPPPPAAPDAAPPTH